MSKLPFSEALSFLTSRILPFSCHVRVHCHSRCSHVPMYVTTPVVSAEGFHFSAFHYTKSSFLLFSLPSALARGFECEIYSQMVRMYVRTCPSRFRNVRM